MTQYATIPGLSRYRFGDDGTFWTNRNTRGNLTSWRELHGTITRKGYRRTILSADDGGHMSALIHCLILTAFRGPCPEGMECCHHDGNKLNNRLDNIRWDTPKANAADTIRLGRQPNLRGSRNGRALLDEPKVAQIKAAILAGQGDDTIRRRFDLTRNQYFKIKGGRTWAHVAARSAS